MDSPVKTDESDGFFPARVARRKTDESDGVTNQTGCRIRRGGGYRKQFSNPKSVPIKTPEPQMKLSQKTQKIGGPIKIPKPPKPKTAFLGAL